MNINWYPGHMKKSTDSIRESLKIVDIVAEIVDARIPFSSRNPALDEIIGDFPRLIIFNKYDLASEEENRKWMEYFRSKKLPVIGFNSLTDRKTSKLYNLSKELLKDKFERDRSKNISNPTIKMMVVGIPNVGKSTFINNVSKRKGTRVGNRPGVTRINQWIKTDSNLLLLDTPGVLWPKFETPDKALNLAFTGAIKDEIMDVENLAYKLIEKLISIDENIIKDRYKVDIAEDTLTVMDDIARKRGCILRGNEIDYNKVANLILDDFRKSRMGRITLETV